MSEAANLFADGKAYERLMGCWSRLVGEKFLDWLSAPNNLKWIDVGCGNGAFTQLLLERCSPALVIGVDPSQGQLAYARERLAGKAAEFRVGSAETLPFPADGFDAATMALAIVFVADPEKAAREMARVVRPGGIVASYMWDFPHRTPLTPLGEAMKSLGFKPPERPNIAASARDAMHAIWQQAELKAIETEAIGIRVHYSSFDDFWRSNSVPAGPSGKALAALTPSAREQLKARLRERLPVAADGSIAYDCFANAAKGRA